MWEDDGRNDVLVLVCVTTESTTVYRIDIVIVTPYVNLCSYTRMLVD